MSILSVEKISIKHMTASKFLIGFYLFSLAASSVFAEPIEVDQKNKEFTLSEVKIKVGDTVRFVNRDSFFHNVFSLSDAKLFDLGSFPKDEYKEVVFDQKGEVEVECALHPNMQMKIIVE